jgi:transposase
VHEVRPNVGVPAIYRYETKPGIQAQVDWAECGYIVLAQYSVDLLAIVIRLYNLGIE